MLSPYLLENRHIAVKHCRHGIFMFSRNDNFVGRGLDLYGEWCDFEIQLLRNYIRFGDTVIDVGANIGTHAVAFGNMVGPMGAVHAFEPQRRLFTMLSGNVALNALEQVVCHQAAVGDFMGEIVLPSLPSPDLHFNFSAVSLMQGNNAGDKVPLVTIDSLNLQKCAAIKIDVEGMETMVLAGARQTIERCQPILYIENNEAESSKRIADALGPLNYVALLVDPSLLRSAQLLRQHRQRVAGRGVGSEPGLRAAAVQRHVPRRREIPRRERRLARLRDADAEATARVA